MLGSGDRLSEDVLEALEKWTNFQDVDAGSADDTHKPRHIGFADPAVELAAAVICNGMPGEMTHRDRAHRALDALYEDLGLT